MPKIIQFTHVNIQKQHCYHTENLEKKVEVTSMILENDLEFHVSENHIFG
jgi:hypothetical protein